MTQLSSQEAGRFHEDKTRLIEFGRFANRRRKGRARPEVFDFLGFTHYCGKTRDGRFLLCPEDPTEAVDPQAEGATPGDAASDAPAASRPARMAVLGAARALRLLRHLGQQPGSWLLPSSGDEGMAAGLAAAMPTAEALMGAAQRPPQGLPATVRTHTRLASTDGLIKKPSRGAGCGKAACPNL